MEEICSGTCNAANHKHREVSRKALLSGLAAVLTGVGLTSLGESASAASKKYKVTAAKNIPVGSAKTFTVNGRSILITQPRKDVFRAFKNACTHQGAPLGSQKLNSGSLMCNQHGATFDGNTGAVKGGPATRALTKYTATKTGTYIYVSI
jgi:nitrite reductase/ring-hydroxylating ferredoxin subunit